MTNGKLSFGNMEQCGHMNLPSAAVMPIGSTNIFL